MPAVRWTLLRRSATDIPSSTPSASSSCTLISADALAESLLRCLVKSKPAAEGEPSSLSDELEGEWCGPPSELDAPATVPSWLSSTVASCFVVLLLRMVSNSLGLMRDSRRDCLVDWVESADGPPGLRNELSRRGFVDDSLPDNIRSWWVDVIRSVDDALAGGARLSRD